MESKGKKTKMKEICLQIDLQKDRSKAHSCDNILFFNIPNGKHPLKFAFLTAAIFALYLIYGFFQELIFQLDGFKPFGLYLTLYQFALCILFSSIERCLRKEVFRKIPVSQYLILAALTVGTMGLSNASVGYLNYPTQVVFKCCKLVPVLIGGILIQGKVYSFGDFVAAFLMSMGLALFTLADSKLSPNFNFTGVGLIMSALVADAAIGNLQEKVLKQYSASNSEMVFYTYLIGFFYLLFSLVILGQIQTAFEFCSEHQMQTYGYGFLFSLTGYFGVNLVLSLVKLYGAFTAVTVTTCRKALTIVLSFILFSKPFTMQYLWSGLIVVSGIYMNLHIKNQSKLAHSFPDIIRATCCPFFVIAKKKVRSFQSSSKDESNVTAIT